MTTAAATIEAYRDDGPLADALARVAVALRLDAFVLTVAGVVPLVVVLSLAGGTVPSVALGLATGWFVLLAGAAAGRPHDGRLAWLVPPVMRVVEYVTLLRLATLVGANDRHAEALCFALVAVLAYHHYDTVYRLRQQRLAPPQWLRYAGGGWELRLFAAYALATAGELGAGYVVAAAVLAVVYVVESAVSWVRFSRAARPRQDFGAEEVEE